MIEILINKTLFQPSDKGHQLIDEKGNVNTIDSNFVVPSVQPGEYIFANCVNDKWKLTTCNYFIYYP